MERIKSSLKAQVIKDLEIKASSQEVRMSAKETPAWIVALLIVCVAVVAIIISIAMCI